jgi:DNA-binding transcriptional MerR regulator
VSAVARRLGVAPATLRTWDRRYGLGPSSHESGLHRRYVSADLARLEVMRVLVRQGVTPAEAARQALDGATSRPPQPVTASRTRTVRTAALRGLLRAATALDGDEVVAGLARHLGRHGAVDSWDRLILPALTWAGEHWATTRGGVEVEHLLTDCTLTALRRVVPRPPADEPPVLLAAAPGEQHTLALYALAAALGERGIPTRVLGASTPLEALSAAVRRVGPGALFLWAQQGDTGDVRVVAGLPVTRPVVRVVVGGPGWSAAAADLPRGAVHATDLTGALDLVTRDRSPAGPGQDG